MNASQKHSRLAIFIGIFAVSLTSTVMADFPHQTSWEDQFGTPFSDRGAAVALAGGNELLVLGNTSGSFVGDDVEGLSYVPFLMKYDAEGNRLWTVEDRSYDQAYAFGLSTDGSGISYVSGYFSTPIDGCCADDAFISKYDQDGNRLWMRTISSPDFEGPTYNAADTFGNVFVAGETSGSLARDNPHSADAFVTKYDTSGNQLWIRQYGSDSTYDAVAAIRTDITGNVYVSGTLENEAFVRKLDGNGNELWTTTLGYASAEALFVASNGDVYLGGTGAEVIESPDGMTSSGGLIYVAKLDADGDVTWVRNFGGDGWGVAHDIVVDGSGSAYVGGLFQPDLFAPVDAYVTKFSASGDELGTRQFSSPDFDEISGLAIDSDSNIYATGATRASLFAPSAGDWDVVLMRLSVVPEPSIAGLVLSLFAWALYRKRSS